MEDLKTELENAGIDVARLDPEALDRATERTSRNRKCVIAISDRKHPGPIDTLTPLKVREPINQTKGTCG